MDYSADLLDGGVDACCSKSGTSVCRASNLKCCLKYCDLQHIKLHALRLCHPDIELSSKRRPNLYVVMQWASGYTNPRLKWKLVSDWQLLQVCYSLLHDTGFCDGTMFIDMFQHAH